jgi:alkylated DNA repair dioxygenase AlkB
LFPLAPVFPPGFSYHPEFISEAEETELIKQIAGVELHTFTFRGYEAKRRVASFGHDYNFETKSLSRGREIPSGFQWIIQRVSQHTRIEAKYFAELLITEYPEGSTINWHRDAFPFDLIAGLSLGEECRFRLRPHDKAKQTKASIIFLPVRRQSLYIIHGDARIHWQHSTAPVKSVRYSITFRTLKRNIKPFYPHE